MKKSPVAVSSALFMCETLESGSLFGRPNVIFRASVCSVKRISLLKAVQGSAVRPSPPSRLCWPASGSASVPNAGPPHGDTGEAKGRWSFSDTSDRFLFIKRQGRMEGGGSQSLNAFAKALEHLKDSPRASTYKDIQTFHCVSSSPMLQ